MPKAKIPSKMRRYVIERAVGRCEYCLANSIYADSPFDVDHINPESAGGRAVSENLALSCHGCNLFKSNRLKAFDPLSGKEIPLFNPRTDPWDDHFAWNSDTSLIVGLTLAGRVTVEALKLNRTGLVNQRKVLAELGLHPPDRDSDLLNQ